MFDAACDIVDVPLPASCERELFTTPCFIAYLTENPHIPDDICCIPKAFLNIIERIYGSLSMLIHTAISDSAKNTADVIGITIDVNRLMLFIPPNTMTPHRIPRK